MAMLNSTERANLRKFLIDRFNLRELKNLAFDLDVPYQLFPHDNKSDFVRELVEHCERHGNLSRLVKEVMERRPNNSLENLLAKLPPKKTPYDKVKCFLSCSFQEKDERILVWFRDLLGAFPDLEVIEARNKPLPPLKQVEECIEDSDLVCTIITMRGGGIPAWISKEVEMAYNEDKIIIAFVEEGILPQSLGILPTITEFKLFQRETLGIKAPEYVKYIINTQVEVLKRQGRDRVTLSRMIELMDALENRDDAL